jgi:hypothetical protein
MKRKQKKNRNKESRGKEECKNEARNKETGGRKVTDYIDYFENKNFKVVNVPRLCPFVHLPNVG